MLLIVWGRIQSQVLLVCVTCLELERQVYLLLISFLFVDCTLFFSWGCISGLKLKCNIFTCSRCSVNDGWLYCAHSHTAHLNFTCRLLCIDTPKCAFEGNILISFHSHCFVPCTVMTVYSVFRVITSLMAFLFID